MLSTKTALVIGSTSGIGLGMARRGGCRTTLHVALLVTPRPPGKDSNKAIDITPAGIRAGHDVRSADTMDPLRRSPWRATPAPIDRGCRAPVTKQSGPDALQT